MNFRVIRAVALAMFREFWRSPEALFWTYGFPIAMMIGLGLAFQPRVPPPVPVAVVAGEASASLATLLSDDEGLEVLELPEAEAERALVRGRVGLLVRGSVDEPVLRADPARAEAQVAELLVGRALQRARGHPPVAVAHEVEDRPGSRYIDFLVPGLIGLNLMGACMWGMGFNLVMMRTNNLLRRLFVTPMKRSDFLIGYMIGRGVLVVPESAAIALLGIALWGVPFRGSVLAFVAVVAAGAFAFTGLALLCASRVRTYEGIAGLMQLCQLPMWVLGGALFSTERFTGLMKVGSDVVPLSCITRALRDLMLEPGGFSDIGWNLVGLIAFGAVSLAVALRLFRWY
ncbi:MAG: ABC transporter permease [Planctomycetes bacterium]|nr:ABC transporter permease [Planctomycetota bacterium]